MKKLIYPLIILGAIGILYVLLNSPSFFRTPKTSDIPLGMNSSILQITAVSDELTRYGSAVIIDSDDTYYYALTNNHIVKDAFDIHVMDLHDDSHDAQLINAMATHDLALISFEKLTELYEMEIAVSYQPGDQIHAMGYPGGLFTTTGGTITRTMSIEGEVLIPVIHHSAMIHHGSSGGALIDSHGYLIGINFAMKDRDGLFIQSYAIPSSKILEFLEVIGHGLS
ncbi:MAG: trypsin-like peptidase domain-containing protein [Acholeplasmataceae bacterium]|jgi:S1-C subfamily serine protease|nr:trypsin-like peptidase domain-containing protein [Acholeplasmataceae bacterium]